VIIVKDFRLQAAISSEMITNLWKWWQVGVPTECWLSIRTVGVN